MGEGGLSYTDEKGNKLFGFSQTSLDRNTFWTRLLVVAIGAFFVYIIWLTIYVIRNNVVNNIVANCI